MLLMKVLWMPSLVSMVGFARAFHFGHFFQMDASTLVILVVTCFATTLVASDRGGCKTLILHNVA